MNRKPHSHFWSLFEQRLRWQDLPPDTRQRVIELLAHLLLERLEASSPQPQEPAHALR